MIGAFSSYVYLGPVQRRLLHRGLGILTYHRLGRPPAHTTDPFLYDSPEELDAHLTAAKAAGLKIVSFSETLTGNGFHPDTLAVTFDDGFTSTLELGLSVLERHQVRAIQYIVAGQIGGCNEWDRHKGDSIEPLMDLAQLRDWLAAGQEIGSHTMTHPNLKKLSRVQAREEIFASKKLLEDRLGIAIEHFCYPHGSWTPEVRELVIEAGYRSACAMRLGVADAESDRWVLPRLFPLPTGRLLRKISHRLGRKFGQNPARRRPDPDVRGPSQFV
jgi:peptidoglycan/xylan/chitin deacetylase (PgdA/CDA1 family)